MSTSTKTTRETAEAALAPYINSIVTTYRHGEPGLTLRGYATKWGVRDSSGEYTTRAGLENSTKEYFALDKPPLYLNHGRTVIGFRPLGYCFRGVFDDMGLLVWLWMPENPDPTSFPGQERALYDLVYGRVRDLSLSGLSIGGVYRRERSTKALTAWHLSEISLTPSPALHEAHIELDPFAILRKGGGW